MESKKLKLTFKDDFNKSKTVSVDYPKDDIKGEEVKIAMEKIIESTVLETKDGKVSKIEKAYIENVKKDLIDFNESL